MLRFSFCPHLLCHGIRQHHYSTMSMPHIDRNLFLLFFVVLGNRQMQRQFPNHHYDPRLWIVHSINQILNDTEWSGSMSCSCDRDHIKSYCPINCYFHLCSFVLHCTFTTNLTLHKTMHHPKNLIRRMTSLNAINRITQKKNGMEIIWTAWCNILHNFEYFEQHIIYISIALECFQMWLSHFEIWNISSAYIKHLQLFLFHCVSINIWIVYIWFWIICWMNRFRS